MGDQAQPLSEPQPPTFNYTTTLSTASFTVSPTAYLSKPPTFQFAYLQTPDLDSVLRPFAFLATGALVFDTSNPTHPLILILQRSPTDSWPLRWETPGGGCDDTDASILDAVARELWEEAGLRAKRIEGPVGIPQFFTSTTRNQICKVSFLIETEKGEGGKLDVKLDPNEHVDFLWASEEEVRVGKVGDKEVVFTNEDQRRVLLEGFEFLRNGEEKEE